MTAHRSSAADTILNYLRTNFGDANVDICADTPLKAVESLDSVARLELILFIEETFGVTVRDEDVTVENFYSVETIAEYINHRADAA